MRLDIDHLVVGTRDDRDRQMHEPYRTLLGHFRPEIGHYYWDRLIRDTTWIGEYRSLFGDESIDYAESLQPHYANPKANWPLHHISGYASSHSWEDWAETWVHYLHMVDGLETAASWSLHLEHALPCGPALTVQPLDPETDEIASTEIEQWLPVSQFINAMDRSLGSLDSDPFIIIEPVRAKLNFIHRVVHAARRGDAPMNFLPRDTTAAPLAA